MGIDNKIYSKQEEKIFQTLTKKQIDDRKLFYNKMKMYFKSEPVSDKADVSVVPAGFEYIS